MKSLRDYIQIVENADRDVQEGWWGDNMPTWLGGDEAPAPSTAPAAKAAPGTAPKPAAKPGAAPAANAPWKAIYDLNKDTIGADPNKIKAGQQLKMPDGSTYTVKAGDNLSKIAKQSGGGTAPAAAPAAPAPAAAPAAPAPAAPAPAPAAANAPVVGTGYDGAVTPADTAAAAAAAPAAPAPAAASRPAGGYGNFTAPAAQPNAGQQAVNQTNASILNAIAPQSQQAAGAQPTGASNAASLAAAQARAGNQTGTTQGPAPTDANNAGNAPTTTAAAPQRAWYDPRGWVGLEEGQQKDQILTHEPTLGRIVDLVNYRNK